SRISAASKTFPETGTADSPGTNGRGANASLQYSPTSVRICWRNSAARCFMPETPESCQELPIPWDGALDSLVQREHRRPAQRLAGARGVQELAPDLVGSLVEHHRLQIRTHRLEDAVDQAEHGYFDFVGEVESQAMQLRLAMQFLSQHQVSAGAVFHVKVIAHILAVGADHGAFAP